eukprot:7310127-Pyramimonas_sp.AAC.1
MGGRELQQYEVGVVVLIADGLDQILLSAWVGTPKPVSPYKTCNYYILGSIWGGACILAVTGTGGPVQMKI